MMPEKSRSPATRRDNHRTPASRRGRDDAFSTAIFTAPHVAVFLILTISLAAAAVLYSQGA